MRNPSAVSDSFGEYIELYNGSEHEVDLEGLKIIVNGNEAGAVTIEKPLIAYIGSYVVLGCADDSTLNGGIPIDYVYSTAGGNQVVLGDSGALELALENDTGTIAWTSLPEPSAGASTQLDRDYLNAYFSSATAY